MGVAIVTLFAFLPALQAGFVNWDDDSTLLENTLYRGLSGEHLAWMFTTTTNCHYHPLTWLSWGVDFVVWGMNPLGYHLGNVLLHASGAVVLYFVILEVLRRGFRSLGDFELRFAGMIGALFFAVHPLRVESVAWATERRDVLSFLFLILAVLAWLRMGGQDTSRARWRWYAVTFGCFLLSLLSKASAMTFPFLLVVLDFYPLRRLSVRTLLDKIPFLATAGVFGVIALRAQQQAGALHSLDSVAFADRLMQSFYGVAWYAWKQLTPLGLGPMYERAAEFQAFSFINMLAALLVVGGLGAAVWVWKRLPFVPASVAWFGLTLGPVLGLVSFGSQIVADRYSYLPSISVGVLVAALVVWLGRRFPGRVVPATASVVVLVFVFLTSAQARVWHDSVSLWTRGVQVDPESAIAHYQLGRAHLDDGALSSALPHLERSLEIRPGNVEAMISLGAARGQTGDAAGAIEVSRQVLEIEPDNPPALFNLAVATQASQRLDEALDYYLRAVAAPPRQFVEARHGTRDTFVRLQSALNAGALCAASAEQDDCRVRINAAAGHPDPAVRTALAVARTRLGSLPAADQARLLEALATADQWPFFGRAILDALNVAHAPEAFARLHQPVPAGRRLASTSDVVGLLADVGLVFDPAGLPTLRPSPPTPEGLSADRVLRTLWPGLEPVLEGDHVKLWPPQAAVQRWRERLSKPDAPDL